MASAPTRRDILRQAGLAGLSLATASTWTLPALAQGETVVPFTDIQSNFNTAPNAVTRTLDIRTIDGPFTPADRFFTTQHYGHPTVDAATYRLTVTGLVGKTLSLSLADLKALGATDLAAGFECSGNSARLTQGFAGNGKWTGVPLRTVLARAVPQASAREFVFFGADRGQEEVEFRNQKFTVEQQFGRSLTREQALAPEPFLAWALNGQPLTVHQGAPVRLIVPGWYGVANVKWLSQVHLQAEAYLGKFQTRWYRTLKEETINGEPKWKETAITRMRVKSVIARVTTDGTKHTVHGFALTDGTPLKSVEVKVDDGPWQVAQLDRSTPEKFAWKLFTYTWTGATKGEHVLVSRATDARGIVQPTAKDLENKKTFLEDNGQFPRRLVIA